MQEQDADEPEPTTKRYTPKESGVYPSGTTELFELDEDFDGAPQSIRLDELEAVQQVLRTRARTDAFLDVVNECTRALSLEPGLVEGYATRARAKSTLGDHAGALDDYDFALALTPDDPELYIERGDARAAAGQLAAAIDDYGVAIDLDPENAGALLKRGALRAARDPAGAAADWDRASALLGPLDEIEKCEALARTLAPAR